MRDFSPEIRAYALRNALHYGTVEPGTILAKLFTHGLEKRDIPKVMPVVQRIVTEVQALTPEARAEAFVALEHLVVEHVEREKELPPLPHAVQGKVVTRFPPEPSKHLHVGHALALLLNYQYAKRYGGRFVVRLEDCNPEKVSQAYADSIIEDITGYLGIEPASISYVSDDMPALLGYAEQLIAQEVAYICQCSQAEMREKRHAGVACACRSASLKETKQFWKQFVKGAFTEGGAVLRYKGDMSADNQIMRDPVLWRRVDVPHFRHGTKYKVWPMYDFYNAIEDSVGGVTHILRSVEFTQRTELQEALKKHLGLSIQQVVSFGRFSVAEKTTQGRELRALVESGEYTGWDDPRLMTLKALRRRGITKEVLFALTQQIGLKKSDVLFEFPLIAALSRKLIDEQTERYTFIPNPVEIEVRDAPSLSEVQFPIHPHRPKNVRTVRITPGVVALSEQDWKTYAGTEIRLVHGYNLKLAQKKKQGVFTSLEIKPLPKVTWLSSFSCSARVRMDDGRWIEGRILEDVASLPVGTVVQFERFGFCKLDRVVSGKKGAEPVYEFWFTHA